MAKEHRPIRFYEPPLPHQARSFPAPPDADEARSLLGEIAAAPCRLAPVAADRPLALYGAGNLGRLARDFLGSVGHDLSFVVDRNAGALAQQDWPGIDLFAPAEVPDKAKRETRLAVAVVTAPYVPIERSLLAAGFGDVVPFYDVSESFRDRHPLSNGWFAPPLSRQDRDCTSRVLALWHDDISRAQHLQFLAWRRLRAEWSFAESTPAPMTASSHKGSCRQPAAPAGTSSPSSPIRTIAPACSTPSTATRASASTTSLSPRPRAKRRFTPASAMPRSLPKPAA